MPLSVLKTHVITCQRAYYIDEINIAETPEAGIKENVISKYHKNTNSTYIHVINAYIKLIVELINLSTIKFEVRFHVGKCGVLCENVNRFFVRKFS